MDLACINIQDSFWTQSLFKRMGFRRRAATTGKVEIPKSVREEIELSLFHETLSVNEKHYSNESESLKL